jgi:hypothetical protein
LVFKPEEEPQKNVPNPFSFFKKPLRGWVWGIVSSQCPLFYVPSRKYLISIKQHIWVNTFYIIIIIINFQLLLFLILGVM